MKSSSIAQQELKFLARGPQLKNMVSTMNLGVLEQRFRCSDIFPQVKLELIRGQDRKESKRIGLGCTVAQKIASTLREALTGDENDSKLVLQVNITVVSNGCANRSARRARSLFNRGSNQGRGNAKLTMAYCLYCRETGAVALTKQLSASKAREADETCKSNAMLLDLAEELCGTIRKEIFFACCSRIPSWQEACMNMLGGAFERRNKDCERSLATCRTESFSSLDTLDSVQ